MYLLNLCIAVKLCDTGTTTSSKNYYKTEYTSNKNNTGMYKSIRKT